MKEYKVADDLNGMSTEVMRLLSPLIDKVEAKTRRNTAREVVARLTHEVGIAFEKVLAEYEAPTKSALMFDAPLDENDPIEKLRFTSSLQHRLRTEGHFTTVGQLRDAGDWDIRVPGIGKGTLAKIDEHLVAAGHPRPNRGQSRGKKPAHDGEETPGTV